ncbi:MAG: prepilin-type N-terminal cleavage/methylation domain-containing protein [bacterium]|nr:prepilin-type N-terminal cleavage/methylation domain-containing protein [bacterium]
MKTDKIIQFKNGFTLLEVLIATSIFAVVMVMTTGVIAQSTSYQTKTKALRDASEETGRISDAIARDLKTASGSLNVTDATYGVRDYKNGLVLLDTDGKLVSLTPSNTSVSLTSASFLGSALIINTENYVRFYVSRSNVIYAKTYTKTDAFFANWWVADGYLQIKSNTGAGILDAITIPANKISSSDSETEAGFSGYTATTLPTAAKIQSYVTYFVHARTKDFDTLAPTNRSEAYVRSMVTMRNYSN